MGGHAGLCLQYFLYGIARDGGVSLGCFHLYVLGSTVLRCLRLYYNLLQLVIAGQLDLQRLLALRAMQHSGFALIANHGEANLHRIFALQLHAELALEVTHRHFPL